MIIFVRCDLWYLKKKAFKQLDDQLGRAVTGILLPILRETLWVSLSNCHFTLIGSCFKQTPPLIFLTVQTDRAKRATF